MSIIITASIYIEAEQTTTTATIVKTKTTTVSQQEQRRQRQHQIKMFEQVTFCSLSVVSFVLRACINSHLPLFLAYSLQCAERSIGSNSSSSSSRSSNEQTDSLPVVYINHQQISHIKYMIKTLLCATSEPIQAFRICK